MRPSETPDVSVILCHHVGDLIYKCVESIKQSIGVSFEIIILTSSSDLALSGIKGCHVNYSEAGPAEKRNIGYRLSKANYLAFFDDDVEIEPECLYTLLKTCQEQYIGMVYGKLYNMEFRNRLDEAGSFLTNTGFLYSRAGQHIEDTGQFSQRVPILSGKSASCIIRADVFHKVGGFDEDFFILGEETDLSWRVWLSGWRVVFEPMAMGYHAFNTRFKPVTKHYNPSRVQFTGCRNYITMLLKNLEAKNLWRILPFHVLIWISAGFAMLITGKMKQGYHIFRGLWYVVRHWKATMRKRERVQSKRIPTDSELWPYIYLKPPKGYYTQRFLRYLSIGLHG